MKHDWKIRKLGEICNIELGKTPYRGNKIFWDTEKKTDNVWLSIADLLNTTDNIVCSSKEHISNEATKFCKPVKKGTLLVSFKLTLGRMAFAGKSLFTNEAIAALNITNEKLIDKYFLYKYLTFFNWDLATRGDLKVKGKTLNKAKLQKIDISFPKLFSEQQRIVTILDKIFSAINKVKANTEKNLKNIQELFESYLQSIFSNKSDNWEHKTLKQVSDIFERGKSKHRPRNDKKLYGGDYPFIQTGDIRNCDHYILEYTQSYNELGLAQSKLWPTGTICITIAANIAETGILTFDACFPDSIIGVVVNNKLADRDFVKYLLRLYRTRLQSLSKGSAQANINMGTFKNELFPFPKIEEQKAIVQKLNIFRTTTKKLEALYKQKLEDLEKLKKSILQQAFNGELKSTEEVING